MHKNNSLSFTHNNRSNKNLKLYFSLFFILIIIVSILLYEMFSYKLLLNNFTSSFDKNKFSEANNLLLTNENFNPFKSFFIEKDLSTYFNDKIDLLAKNINNGDISLDDAQDIASEINRYNIISLDVDNLFASSTNDYNKGLSLFNSKDYIKAYDSFSKVASSDNNYENALSYIKKCKDNIKSNILSEATKLAKDHYYTKALTLIQDVNHILGKDSDIISKVDDLKKERSQYLAKQNQDQQASSSSIINSISKSNINELVIESITPYLVHVDLNAQKTYVYKGKLRNWNLEKTFSCSTGISSESTPQGVYTVGEKGEWFFSDEYQQGGKYWVQFLGDYLFHSLPYNEDKSKILDYTLGKPASHGCIRLLEEDSKWIYDNIPKGSKVIIK